MSGLRERLGEAAPVLAPLVLNPLMARLAEAQGFEALYLGGGATGYTKVFLEANLTVTELAQAGVEIRAASALPLILDAAGGWGDPMHMHRTVTTAEAAGFAAIEIEDQHLPKRAHHHIGVEHMIPAELMAAKVREALAVRRSSDFLVVARTNAVRVASPEEAVRRLLLYHLAGADLLLPSPRTQEEARFLADRLPAPLMFLAARGGPAALDMTADDLGRLGFKLLVDAQTPLLAAFRVWRDCYRALADGLVDPAYGPEECARLQDELHEAIDLERLLAVERATVEGAEV